MPLMGVSRHIVVADSDEEAKALVRPAYALLAAHHGQAVGRARRRLPARGAPAARMGRGRRRWARAAPARPATVRAFVEREIAAGGVNYFVSALAFGDLPLEAAIRSAELFAPRSCPRSIGLAPTLTLFG